jgi:CheY-like chemotaxis protein
MGKILVVDDSAFARLNICRVLKSAGHEILEAANGREGLDMVMRLEPDCILSDLLMPEMDGIGFLAALRERRIALPVIVLTADIQETKKRQCLDLGAVGFLHKPPQKEELLDQIESTLSAGR